MRIATINPALPNAESWARRLADEVERKPLRVNLDRSEAGSALHTDEASAYRGLAGMFYSHETINHGQGEYVRDGVTTNGVESVFAVLKRGLIGVYHHTSKKHLGRYVDEFAFRLNEGNVNRHTMERLDSFVTGVAGKRLTYKQLIH
jgi:hypothetical protein